LGWTASFQADALFYDATISNFANSTSSIKHVPTVSLSLRTPLSEAELMRAAGLQEGGPFGDMSRRYGRERLDRHRQVVTQFRGGLFVTIDAGQLACPVVLMKRRGDQVVGLELPGLVCRRSSSKARKLGVGCYQMLTRP
jgi:hypothetical protein